MTQITDRTTIRAILETDRPWAAYALADLEPGFFEYSTGLVPSVPHQPSPSYTLPFVLQY
jgi:hypothetical protein